MRENKIIDWYLDPISPFAYFQFQRFHELPRDTKIVYRPVLLAGLLGHWGHKGPAEIPAKRAFTYQYCTWLAKKRGLGFRMPSAHPFNSLPALRLIAAAGCSYEAVAAVLFSVWVDGMRPDVPEDFARMADAAGIDNAGTVIKDEKVKAVIIDNGKRAIEAGVFGVPTFVADGHVFWGQDSTDFLMDYLRHPDLFDTRAMKAAAATPVGASRPGIAT